MSDSGPNPALAFSADGSGLQDGVPGGLTDDVASVGYAEGGGLTVDSEPVQVKLEEMDAENGDKMPWPMSFNVGRDDLPDDLVADSMVKTELREDEDSRGVELEDEEALWDRDEDPDFDISRFLRQKKASKRRLRESQDDEADWEGGSSRAESGRPGGRRESQQALIDEERSQECEYCGKTWISLGSLLKHLSHVRVCKDHYGEDRVQAMRTETRRGRYSAKDAEKAERDRLQRIKNYYDNRQDKLQKSREYYQRNRDRITLAKRLRYSKGGIVDSGKRGRARSIRTTFKEPDKPQGTVRWRRGHDESELGRCEMGMGGEPCSKLDLGDAEQRQGLETLPDEYELLGRLILSDELDAAHGIVGMAVGDSGDHVEVRPLLSRDDINLAGMREVWHSVMAVTGTNMKDLLEDKGSSMPVVNPKNLSRLRNDFSKAIIANGNKIPELPKPICLVDPSRERTFLSTSPDEVGIPGRQLLVNYDLSPCDMGAVGVECRFDDDRGKKLLPLFTVNMDDWRHVSRYFFGLLVNWVGTRDLLEEMTMKTPCGLMGKELAFHQLKLECHQNCLQPRTVSICEHCGKTFEYNPYLLQEKAKYDKHISTHNTTCRICGQVFPTAADVRNHRRTHNKVFFRCIKEDCKFVANTQKTLDTHVQFFHTRIMCELCGKEYTSRNSLKVHITITHKTKKKSKDLVCSHCGKMGFISNTELRKHERRHLDPKSMLNKWMKHKAEDYKYVCPLHDNCTKYFRKASFLRNHMKKFANREYPDNLAQKFRPVMPDEIEKYEAQFETQEEAETRRRKQNPIAFYGGESDEASIEKKPSSSMLC